MVQKAINAVTVFSAHQVTEKSFHYVGKSSFLLAFLVVAKTATPVFRLINGYMGFHVANKPNNRGNAGPSC